MNGVYAILFCCAVGYLATLVAYRRGRETGRDEGWVEHYQQTEAEKKARRDAQTGRYRSLRAARVAADKVGGLAA